MPGSAAQNSSAEPVFLDHVGQDIRANSSRSTIFFALLMVRHGLLLKFGIDRA